MKNCCQAFRPFSVYWLRSFCYSDHETNWYAFCFSPSYLKLAVLIKFEVFKNGAAMSEITDEFMTQMLSRARDYSIVILKAGPNHSRPGADKIIWEHARRNFLLQAGGLLPIVCPITDKSDLAGIGIFNADIDLAKSIMDQDPAIKEGIFVYEAHPCRSFPGDCLPGEEIGDHKGGKGREDLSRHHGLLKGDPILDRMEADAKFVRDSAKSRM